MFSQTTEYAVRALIEIATRPDDKPILAGTLAETLDIPHHYLAKILQQLVRTRVLKSVRGRQGGFSLNKPAGNIRLRDIVQPFEDLHKFEECILGQPVCSEAGACPLHDFWGDVRKRWLDELDTKTLQDLSFYQLRRLNNMNAGLFKRVGKVPGKTSLKAGKGKRSSSKKSQKKQATGAK
ncbi:MAG: Rrf2 family transcriptional regulator [Planctomycetes bacterium]|nr:Rrf2 family transcriptional regulator [Planctomycetota bacterium]